MARYSSAGETAATGRINRGKYTFVMIRRFCSRLRVTKMSDRSKSIHVAIPHRKNRK
jgi:hypothetical protein